MSKPKILVQLDTDPLASVFDGVVAVDSGVDQLFTRAGVTPDNVRDLVFGAIFTRGPDDLHNTALFVGGSNVAAGDKLVSAIKKAFFGPLRVSVLMDSNGANTTAAAAVLAVERSLPLADVTAVILAGTGPVGQRVARLLAGEGAAVRLASRDLGRAQQALADVAAKVGPDKAARIVPVKAGNSAEALEVLPGANVVIAAGAPGVELLSAADRQSVASLRVAIDLNAVPPVGLGGVESADHGVERAGVSCYGALGIGRTKMKIHKRAVQQLFAARDQVLDAEEIFALGRQLS